MANLNTDIEVVEPLCDEKLNPYLSEDVLFPDLLQLAKDHSSTKWSVVDVDLTQDYSIFKKLPPAIQKLVVSILVFFAPADGMVNENVMGFMLTKIRSHEARRFFIVQAEMEQVHADQYKLLLETYVPEKEERVKKLDALENDEYMSAKIEWCNKWLNSDADIVNRVFAFACVENLFFQGEFAIIYWLKEKGFYLPALHKSNVLISKDESLHVNFGCALYRHFRNGLSSTDAELIVREAVEIEQAFLRDIIANVVTDDPSTDLQQVSRYIEFAADYMLQQMKLPTIFNVENPFPFMKLLYAPPITDFLTFRELYPTCVIVGDTTRMSF